MRALFGFKVLASLFMVTAPFSYIDAQTATNVARIGILAASASSDHLVRAFIDGMREHGYVEGKNVRFDRRYHESSRERMEQQARELASAEVALILAMSTPASLAAKKATMTIPIVFALVADPIDSGLVRSLAAPSGNITGFSLLNPELRAKRIEILHDLAPKLIRIGVLHDPRQSAIYKSAIPTVEKGAKAFGKELLFVEVGTAGNFDDAFLKLKTWRAEALVLMESPFVFMHKTALLERATQNGLPTVTASKEYAEAGGLIAYGASYADIVRRSASYAARILKGAKPADLPVQQPLKFELVINMKTARALGLSVPAHLLQRADRLIE